MKLITRKNKNLLIILIFIFAFAFLLLSNTHNNFNINQANFDFMKPNIIYYYKQDVKNKLSNKEHFDNYLKPQTTQTTFQVTNRNRFFAIDGSGMGSVNTEVVKCSGGIEVEVLNSANTYEKADFTYFLDSVPSRDNIKAFNKNNKKHYYMVFGMESEPHSGGGETWHRADFKMWYNLDQSFPEPATYFDVKSFLPDLLAKPKVEFENKENTPLVWVLSNCAAFNSREKFVDKLMKQINVDSFGFCLRNKETHTSIRMQGNIDLYSKYKFVIAIENSNCEDYITEKLVHAVASGSIPIVAGKDNKPNYLKFMPKNSYINIYDYNSIDDLVKHLKLIESNKQEYEKFIHFKRKHNYTREYLSKLSLNELINVAKTIFNYENEKHFFDGLILKEKSENKLCKIARYLKNTPESVIDAQINSKRSNRPIVENACLPHGNLGRDF